VFHYSGCGGYEKELGFMGYEVYSEDSAGTFLSPGDTGDGKPASKGRLCSVAELSTLMKEIEGLSGFR